MHKRLLSVALFPVALHDYSKHTKFIQFQALFMQLIKDILRNILMFLHLDLSKNLLYDRLTHTIITKELKTSSNCVDIGCHKGEILQLMQRHAPKGRLFAFEPIPELFEKLKRNHDYAQVYPYALGRETSTATFQHVLDAPAYSGLQKRKYDVENPSIKEIEVEVEKLDNVIPEGQKIDFVKIDVEGGEYDVLQGAQGILAQSKPILLFEFGLGASDFYKTKPEDMFGLLKQYNYSIFTLKDYIRKQGALSEDRFKELYYANKEYYFIAC